MSGHSSEKATEKEKKEKKEKNDKEQVDLDICKKAPEWAEHERFRDDDQPCDDGRTGNI